MTAERGDIAAWLDHAPGAGPVWQAVLAAAQAAGPVELRVSRSQIGLWRAHPFAAVWRPADWLKGSRPPLVLTLFSHHPIPSSRWKAVAEPAPGRFSHHLELWSSDQVDAEVAGWLATVAQAASGAAA